jgi:hypothetical protein
VRVQREGARIALPDYYPDHAHLDSRVDEAIDLFYSLMKDGQYDWWGRARRSFVAFILK